MAASSTPLYIQIAEGVLEQIENGTLRVGEKVPSLRRLSKQKRVSISTALQTYMWLESRGHLEARPKSGFLVRRPFASLIPEPRFGTPRTQPHLLGANDILATLVAAARDPECDQSLRVVSGLSTGPQVRRDRLDLHDGAHRAPRRRS